MLIVVLAVLAALVIWDFYVTAPWTRDGSVRVQVAGVAPQVSGQITEIRVVDNQYVRQGDVLYVIDPFDFQGGARHSQSAAASGQPPDLQVKRTAGGAAACTSPTSPRHRRSSSYSSATPSRRRRPSTPPSSRSHRADINLKRTQVRSPVNGYVTNLLHAGRRLCSTPAPPTSP